MPATPTEHTPFSQTKTCFLRVYTCSAKREGDLVCSDSFELNDYFYIFRLKEKVNQTILSNENQKSLWKLIKVEKIQLLTLIPKKVRQ